MSLSQGQYSTKKGQLTTKRKKFTLNKSFRAEELIFNRNVIADTLGGYQRREPEVKNSKRQ